MRIVFGWNTGKPTCLQFNFENSLKFLLRWEQCSSCSQHVSATNSVPLRRFQSWFSYSLRIIHLELWVISFTQKKGTVQRAHKRFVIWNLNTILRIVFQRNYLLIEGWSLGLPNWDWQILMKSSKSVLFYFILLLCLIIKNISTFWSNLIFVWNDI